MSGQRAAARATPRAARGGRERTRPRRAARRSPPGSVSGAARWSASSRAPAAVTVRSIVARRLPLRSPASVAASSRLRRVAASICMTEPGATRRGGVQMRRPALLRQRDVIDERAGRRRARRGRNCRTRRARRRRRNSPAGGGAASLSKRGLGNGVRAGFHSAKSSKNAGPGQHPLGHQDLARRRGARDRRRARPRWSAPARRRRSRDRARRGPISPPASAMPARYLCRRASSSPSSVRVPAVTTPDDRPAYRPLGAAPPRLGRILDLVADRDLEPGADQPGADRFRRCAPARRTSGCRRRRAGRAWSARYRAPAPPRPHPRRTARRNPPSGRTTGSRGSPF